MPTAAASAAAAAKPKPKSKQSLVRSMSRAMGLSPPDNEPDDPLKPSVKDAEKKASRGLPKDPITGKNWAAAAGLTSPKPFQSLSLGTYIYMHTLQSWFYFYGVVLLVSISSMVQNAYGHMLDDKQASFNTFLFTFTSLGNSDTLTPAYGSSELVITCMLTIFLYWSTWQLRIISRRAERLQITPADFAVQVDGLPQVNGEKITKALGDALKDPELFALSSTRKKGEPAVAGKVMHMGVALSQRDMMRKCREYESIQKVVKAQEEARGKHEELKAREGLTEQQEERLQKLIKAIAKGRTALADSAAEISELVHLDAWKSAKPPRDAAHTHRPSGRSGAVSANLDLSRVSDCAGTAFVSFDKASDAMALIYQKTLRVYVEETDVWGREGKTMYDCKLDRPAEPSDIIWENLESKDGWKRQLRGTFYLTLLSFSGTFVISVVSFLQPKALSRASDSTSGSAVVGLIGTVLVVAGYLVVFLVVPTVEDKFMRHKTVTDKEVSTVLKLVAFQVLATIATANIFVLETGGDFNRDWYMTGGFILINGMIVDMGFITCVVQGWNLGVQISRRVAAPTALTQLECDEAFAVKADGYVIDRLQMTSKFVVMTYIYSSAMPLLWAIVVCVVLVSQYFDSRNLLRVFQPPPQSDESAVRAILVYVMPLAVLGHLFISYVMLNAMNDENTDDWLSETFSGLSASVTKLANVTHWSEQLEKTRGIAVGGGALGLLNVSKDVLGLSAFGQPEDDALDMVWLSVLINTPLVVIFILREWGRQWGKELPVELLLRAPGKAAAIGGHLVKDVADRVTSLLPDEKLKDAVRAEIEGASHEAKSLYSKVQDTFDEEKAYENDETRRKEAEEKELSYQDMLNIMENQGFKRKEQLYYAPTDRTSLIESIVSEGGAKSGKGVVLNSKGTPLKVPKSLPPTSGAAGKFMV